MRNNPKKVLIVMLALVSLTAVLLSSCTPAPAATTATTAAATTTAASTTAGTTTVATTAKPEILKIAWASWLGGACNNSTDLEKQLEAKIGNVDFQLVMFERSTFPDQFKTRAAGGDIPDFFPSPYDNYGMITQGIAAAFDISMIKENMPGYFQSVAQYNEKYNCEAWAPAFYAGKFYGLPTLNVGDVQPFALGWRKDWLDEVGIAKVPETIAECEAAFLAFIKGDPDKNGKVDSYGICINGKNAIHTSFAPFLMAYGSATLDDKLIKDGKLVDPMATSEMRTALKNLNKWYGLGILDKEFVTLNSEWDLYVNNKIGFVNETYYQFNAGDWLSNKIKEFRPDATFVIGNTIKGPDGLSGLPHYGPTSGNMFMFGKKNEKDTKRLAAIMKVFNTIFTDKELERLMRFGGKEGVDYTRDPVTGEAKYIAALDTVEKRAGLGTNFSGAYTGMVKIEDQMYFNFKWNVDYNAIFKKTGAGNVAYWVRSGITHDKTGSTLTASMADIVWASLNPLRQQWFIDFITGTKSLDTQWEEWLKAWEKAGGKQMQEYWTAGYLKDAEVIKTVKGLIK